MMQAVETLRLNVRPFSADDVVAAFSWFGDPEVMRFTTTGPDALLEDTRKRLASYRQHQATHGFSKWIIRDRGSGEPIGDSGLLVLEGSGDIDLGVRFARVYWGQGLATEVGSAWVRAAFIDLRLDRLTAFAHPQNLASLRVLEKLGFRSCRGGQVMGMQAVTFSLDAKDFRRRA